MGDFNMIKKQVFSTFVDKYGGKTSMFDNNLYDYILQKTMSYCLQKTPQNLWSYERI